jgi:hypothetical protein
MAKKYSLSHWKADKPDAEIDDHYQEVVAEGETIKGLLRFAQLKKLDEEEYFIEHNFYELIRGIRVPDTEMVGYLYQIKQQNKKTS